MPGDPPSPAVKSPANADQKLNAPATTMRPFPSALKFGPYTVTSQVFHVSSARLSIALVNLKPLLPGHVLVCPTRVVPRLSQLTIPETTDLFLTVRRVSRMIERVYNASSLNIAVQDGIDAGQSVPHVHVHIIPRRARDLDDRGGSDAIYGMMNGEEGDMGKHLRERDKAKESKNWDGPDAEERRPRSEEEMQQEAGNLRQEMEKEPKE